MGNVFTKKVVLTLAFAFVFVTGFSRFTLQKSTGRAAPPEVFNEVYNEIKTGFTKFNRMLKNAASIFAPTGTTSGLVYRDNNANGTRESSEPIMTGVTVNLYTASNATTPCGTTTSTTSGWSITSASCTGSLRVEFVMPTTFGTGINDISATDFPGVSGGSSVQFVNDGDSNVNFGIMNPAFYSQANPKMAVPVFQATGDGSVTAMQMWSYNNVGTTGDATSISTMSQIGSTWGLAYDKVKRKLYSAAVLKAHNPLGPEGLDAIYVTDPATGISSKFVELQDDFGIAVSSITAEPQYISNATREVNDFGNPENDSQAFQDVGKVGLGDLDISADGKTLYVVNLFDKKIYAINIASKSITNTYTIPNPGCTGGTYRPWGMAVKNDQLFVGVICDGSTSGNNLQISDQTGVNNLNATIYKLSGGTFTSVLSFPLNFTRENPFEYAGTCNNVASWKPWISGLPQTCDDSNVAYPTPILTDIEFDPSGNMILGFTDRTGFQFDAYNYGPSGTTILGLYVAGDILRACVNSSGTSWGIESVASSCASTTGGPGNNGGLAIGANDVNGYYHPNSGPTMNAKPGEFFWGDYFHNDGDIAGNTSWFPGHPEIAVGGLAVLPGSGEVISTAYDPVTGAANFNTGGVIALSTTDGSRSRNGFQLYATPETGPGSPTGGKGVGLGDLEILSDPAPIELGNRLWIDTDQDGIQDPGEAVLDNVTLELFVDADLDGVPDGPAIGTSTTNATGNYLFNTVNVADGDPSLTGNQPGPAAFTNYIIRVANSDWSAGVGVGDLVGYAPTTSNVGGAGQADVRDSDGNLINGFLQVSVLTGNMGESNHTLDFGFFPSVSLGSTVFIDVNNNGLQDAGEGPIEGASVQLYDGAGVSIGSPVLSDVNGNYFFGNLAPGNYRVGVTPAAGSPYQVSSTDPSTIANLSGTAATDLDDNGVQATPGGEALSGVITLAVGAESTTETGTGGDQDTATGDANGNMTVDFGFLAPLSLGSTAFIDTNNNGTQDMGEAGIAGLTVNLYAAANPMTVIASTTTDMDGNYVFNGLAAGSYIVGVVPNATYPVASATVTANTGSSTDVDGKNNGSQTGGAGESKSGTIALAADTQPTTEAGQGATGLTAADANGNATIDFGFFAPPLSLGSTVFNDANNNGTQDLGEVGIASLTVNLYAAADPMTVIATTTTDMDGNYVFNGLLAGNYIVGVVPNTTYPVASTSVTANSGLSTDVDGKNNGTQVGGAGESKSGTIAIAAGTQPTTETGQGDAGLTATDANGNATIDFGFFAPSLSLGSTAFIDANNNGTQDMGEAGIASLTVNLYAAADPMTVIASTTTDMDGNYVFNGLLAGNYIVGVVPNTTYSVASATVTANTGSSTDVDGKNNGSQTGGAGESKSGTIALAAGTQPTAEAGQGAAGLTAADANGNATVDFGFFAPASLGNFVWNDLNGDGLQTAGEPGIEGVIVTLTDANNVVTTTTTDATGAYSFNNLIPGTYSVSFSTPATFISTFQNVGADDTKDSDGPEVTGIVLAAGDNNTTIDMGFITNDCDLLIGGIIYIDNSGTEDGVNGTPIDGPALGVYMTLVVNDDIYAVTPVNASGYYQFNNLPADIYKIVMCTTPTGSKVVQLPVGYKTVSEGGDVPGTTGGLDTNGVSEGDGTNTSESTIIATCIETIYEKLGREFPFWPGKSNNGVGGNSIIVQKPMANKGAKVAAGTSTYLENDFGITLINPLEVSLVNFSATKVEKGVNLSWKVASEKDFSHYEVERSDNAREFGKLANVKGMGKSIYNNIDTNPLKGMNYYRLKMVDMDGTYKYSNIVSLNNETAQFMNLVNPAKGGEVSLTTNIENAKFVVTTTSGKTIPAEVQSLGAGKYKLSMSNTSTGMYIIHAMGANGNLTRKVILE